MVLQAIRERLTGLIAIFIFVILIIPFAFVGVSSYFQSDSVNNVALVNDEAISVTEFNQSFQNYRRRMQSMLGENFDAEQFDQAIVRRQHLDNMIDDKLLAQASLDAGLTVANDQLAQQIRNTEAFRVDGEFNARLYQTRLQAQGISTRQFENDMRARMILSQLPSTIAGSAITTGWELNQFVRLQDQERAFQAILIPAHASSEETDEDSSTDLENPEEADDTKAEESVTEEVAQEEHETEEAAAESIAEEEITAWYESHQQDYRTEEQVIIEYLELDAATMGGAVEPDEELLLARFEEQKGRFVTPESRLASHILIEVAPEADDAEVESARQIAEELSERARSGEDFADLAREYSQDSGSAPDGGDLGWIEPGFMVQAFEDGLYELSLENPISGPVQTGFGWHVIYLREIRPSEGMTFTEARELLRDEFVAEEDERRFLEQADRLVDIIYEDPTTLEGAANEMDLEIQVAGPFGRSGGFGIAENPQVVKEAFSDLVLLQGAVSDPVSLGDNHIVLVKLGEYLPETIKPLEEVREQVVASIRKDHAMQAARSRAEELLASLSPDSDLAVIAEAEGLELVASEAAKRGSEEIDADLREALFLMDPPGESGPITAIAELTDGFAVVRLTGVTDGVLSEEDALREQAYRRRLSNATASAEALGFVRMLRSQSVIEIFEDRL